MILYRIAGEAGKDRTRKRVAMLGVPAAPAREKTCMFMASPTLSMCCQKLYCHCFLGVNSNCLFEVICICHAPAGQSQI